MVRIQHFDESLIVGECFCIIRIKLDDITPYSALGVYPSLPCCRSYATRSTVGEIKTDSIPHPPDIEFYSQSNSAIPINLTSQP